jgi:hypothetical protein
MYVIETSSINLIFDLIFIRPNKKRPAFPFPDRPCFKPPRPKKFLWDNEEKIMEMFHFI